jgi:hypothetical protein
MENDIRSHGGFAMTAELKPRTSEQLADLRRLFDRSAEYGSLVERISAAKASLPRLGARRGQTLLRRLERQHDRLAQIDFFPGEAKAQATTALSALKAGYQGMFAGGEPRFSKRGMWPLDQRRYQKRVWATRKAPWVDRLASAWLIKRFIDRDARFAWIARPSECPDAVGYDFDGAEFTRQESRDFPGLLGPAWSTDTGLAAIGAAVHFLDVGGIPRPTPGARDHAGGA